MLYPEQAIRFLSRIQPKGYWSLSALGKDHSASASARFDPSQVSEITAWLTAQAKLKRDLYFRCALAKTVTGQNGAMSDEDVSATTVLWADVDAPPDIKKSTELAVKKRWKHDRLQQLKKELTDIPPSIVNDSGSGLHLFWVLRQAISIGPGFSLLDLSAILNGLAKKCGGDTKCKNPSRLLRLVGTQNVKQAGMPLLCHTLEENDYVYEASAFEQYRDDSYLSKAPTAIAEIEPAPVIDLSTLDLPEDLRRKIETGIDPKTGLTWTDRSQLMNHIAVELVKLGIDSSVILSILMDSRYHHSGHVWECREPLREARRTVNWALNRGADDSTSRLNRNYFMVCVGGKMFFGWDDEGQLTAIAPREICNVEDFKREIAPIKEYTTKKGKDGNEESVEINVFKKWIEDEARRRFYPKGYIIDPHRSHDNGYYNLWKGYAVRASKGVWPLMQENIRCLCEGDRGYYNYVMNWAALLVQHPTELPRTALVFHGDQGTGKTLFASAFSKIFAQHAYKIDKPEQLVGRFSGHLDSKIFIHAEECKFEHAGLGVLKSLVTDEMVSIERKGAQPYQARNYAHVLVTTNNEHVLPVEQGNRRFVIFRPLKDHKGDSAFWTALVDEMQNGGYEAMLYDLLSRNIKGWNPEATKPETESMKQHKRDTMSGAQSAIKNWIERGDMTALALERAEDRYKIDRREADRILNGLGIIVTNTGVIVPPREELIARWKKVTGDDIQERR